ncbi:MAG: MBL fold metallo-hydrolase [bacterium]|nr:MBL fold metallo-hydrolase [bacterium]
MKIKWYGHSTFGVTSSQGIRILTDPYVPGSYDGAVGYAPIEDEFDIVLQSHDHPDHAGSDVIKGDPVVVTDLGEQTVKGVKVKGVLTYHDHHKGENRGENTVFNFEVDGINVCFCGDLGHPLEDNQVAEIGRVDVLMVPIGGHFTIDDKEAWMVAEALKSKAVIPMHYKTEVLGFPIANLDPFVAGKDNVERVGSYEIEIDADDLTDKQRVIILDYVG